jgi:hypothetical protein
MAFNYDYTSYDEDGYDSEDVDKRWRVAKIWWLAKEKVCVRGCVCGNAHMRIKNRVQKCVCGWVCVCDRIKWYPDDGENQHMRIEENSGDDENPSMRVEENPSVRVEENQGDDTEENIVCGITWIQPEYESD